jgi:magnesium-protoporphyrin O-methyltransferase
MASCCEPDPDGYRDMFTPRRARRAAQQFRTSGLDRDSRRIVDFLETLGIQGASILDVGGGVGPLHLELLRRGAARATSIELVDSYDAEADALAQELGLAGRVTRLHGDLAADPDLVSRHDIVVMHRVVCCYPDANLLLAAAADHAGRALVFSHPPRNVLARAAVGAENLTRRVRGQRFRVFVHDPRTMLDAAADGGRLQPLLLHHGLAWDIAGLCAEPPTITA